MPKVSIITPVKLRSSSEREWLAGCIQSVLAQTEQDWEMIIVDDHTDPKYRLQELDPQEQRIRIAHLAPGKAGVANARNAAARLARSELLLPLDADDQLGPTTVQEYLAAWQGKGFLYPSVTLFGNNEGEVTVAPIPYDFDRLMLVTYLLVGNLHLKSDWERAGGWRTDMAQAFEDWEYWLHLGEMGVCGTPCPNALYAYRRNPHGRIAALKSDPLATSDAINQLRAIHAELYKGVRPMACCGGRTNAATKANLPAVQARDVINIPGAANGLVRLRYMGSNAASTPWYGPVTNTTYRFSASKPVSYVDVRDAERMVAIMEARQRVFEILPDATPAAAKPVAQAAELVAPEPVPEPTPAVTPESAAEPATVPEPAPEVVPEPELKRKRTARKTSK